MFIDIYDIDTYLRMFADTYGIYKYLRRSMDIYGIYNYLRIFIDMHLIDAFLRTHVWIYDPRVRNGECRRRPMASIDVLCIRGNDDGHL